MPENKQSLKENVTAKFVAGDIVELKTIFLYTCTESMVSWDYTFSINS